MCKLYLEHEKIQLQNKEFMVRNPQIMDMERKRMQYKHEEIMKQIEFPGNGDRKDNMDEDEDPFSRAIMPR